MMNQFFGLCRSAFYMMKDVNTLFTLYYFGHNYIGEELDVELLYNFSLLDHLLYQNGS